MGTDVKLIVQYNRRPAAFKVHGRPWSGTVNHTNPNYQTWDSAPALGLAVPSGIASLPYSRIPGEHIGVGDRW